MSNAAASHPAEPDPPRRRIWRVSLGGAALTLVLGAGSIRAGAALSPDLLLLAVVPPLLVLGGHWWAARWRFLLALALSVVPSLLLFGATALAIDDREQTPTAYVVVALASVLTLGTGALAAWVANRWGRRARFSLSDLGHVY